MLKYCLACLLLFKTVSSSDWFSDADHYWDLDSIWYDRLYESRPYGESDESYYARRWTGIVRGNVEVSRSIVDVGINLDGTTGWLDFGARYNTCYVDVTFCQNGMSVALWVRLQELRLRSTNAILMFGGGESGLNLAYTDDGKIELNLTSGLLGQAWRLVTLSDTIRPGIWYHVLFTWNVSNGIDMFINGLRLSNATFYTEEEEASNQTCKEYGNCSIDWQLAVGKSLSPLAYSAIDVDELTLWSTVVGDDTIRQASKDIRALYRSNTGCYGGWLAHLQSCYKVVTSPRSWDTARASCEGDFSSLASVGSKEEFDFLQKEIQRRGVSSCLSIGLRQEQVSGSFIWIDNNVGTFTRLVAGNETSNSSHCVQWMSDGTWHRGSCNTQCGYICKRSRSYLRKDANFYCQAKRRDMALVRHRLKIRVVQSELECALECLMYGGHCMSYNLQYTDNYPYVSVNEEHLCELNRVNHITSPLSLVMRDGYQYCERL